jgi:hypothetical protein
VSVIHYIVRYVLFGHRTPKPVTKIVTTSWSGGPVLPIITDTLGLSSGALGCGGWLSGMQKSRGQCLMMLEL